MATTLDRKSPFPGMDPFLEFHWRDVHHALVTYTRDQLQQQLPAELLARMQERVIIADQDQIAGSRYPDVHVVEFPSRGLGGGTALAVEEAVVAPYIVEYHATPLTETYIEILDAASGHRVVTVIEFLSPTNKLAGSGREEYLRKRHECLDSGTHLVEVDLTRTGPRASVLPLDLIPPQHHSTYIVCVSRLTPRRQLEYYPIPLPTPLPSFRIPLRPKDQDVILRLQPLVDQAYANGRYHTLDYRRALEPPLSQDEASWTDELLRQRRR